jgi:hypothetical protein
MLESVFPIAVVHLAVWPVECALAFFLFFDVVAFVSSFVGPLENAVAMHHRVSPVAVVGSAVVPEVLA